MYLFDSDHLSILWYDNGVANRALNRRLDQCEPDQFFTSIITVEEQLRGWLNYIRRAKAPGGLVHGYEELERLFVNHQKLVTHPFDAAAVRQYERLRSSKLRVGTMDLRIASIAIVRQCVLLTRNAVDFERVPGLKHEDWTAA